MDKKWFWMVPVGMLVGLYTTFVLQQLWNWFVVPPFHVSEISFWGMYGLNMLAGLAFGHIGSGDGGDEFRWKWVMTVLEACVPEGRSDEVAEKLKEQTEGISLYVDIGISILKKIGGNTFTLLLAWAIHVLLL